MNGGKSEALYVIAKAPRPGLVKTRLGAGIGHERAVALYRAFVADLAARFSGSPYEPGWYVTPSDAPSELRPLIGERADTLVQCEGDLTERQRELFRMAADRGERRVVLVASDSPHLEVETVRKAFLRLEDRDVVLGPTHDGGYYLIGLRDPREALSRGVLGGVPMSTGAERDRLVEEVQSIGLSIGWVEPVFDVDVEEDLRHLRAVADRPDLSATRAALESLGLLHEPGAVAGNNAECKSG